MCSATAESWGESGGDSVCGLENADVWHSDKELMSQPLIKARDRVIGLSDERVSQGGSRKGGG